LRFGGQATAVGLNHSASVPPSGAASRLDDAVNHIYRGAAA
jgi:hypothetical protein